MKGYLLIIGSLIIIISVLITLNIFFQRSLQMEIAEQFNKQQLLLSNSIADNMKIYFHHWDEQAISIFNILSKTGFARKEDFNWVSKAILRENEIIKTNLGVISDKGEIIFYSGERNLLKSSIPMIIKRARDLSMDKTAIMETASMVYIISPVYRQSNTKVIIFLSVKIHDIGKHFLGNIKSGNRGYAWMMDKRGTLLYHPTQPGMVGGNIYKADPACFKCHTSFDLEKKVIEGKTGNYGRYIAPSGEDKIIAFSTVSIDTPLWIIAVSAPYSEVTLATRRSMELYSYLIIAIFATTSIISALLIIFNKKRIKAEEAAKRERELERYASELEDKVKERTSELVTEKEKLNTIVSAIGGGIMLIDRKGVIQWSNEQIKEMAGFEVRGMTCDEICSSCSIVFSSQSKGDVDTTIMSNLFGQKDRYYQVTNAPIKGADGEVHGYIRLIQDVTEVKKMEEQIVNSEKLASIGRLAAGIAHEIGNPLTSIFSFVQILREMEDSEFKKESLDTIYFHINRISEILKQLSGFTKMPAGEASKCLINDIIETSLNLIQYDKKAKNVSIVKELSLSLPEVLCSGNQLSQVFVNLTLNAIDAMPDGGTLTIKSMIGGNNIVIKFKDTGSGIPKEDITKVFDPFYTTKEKGTGLGLAVSYDIIKKMNGTLDIESEIGKGSVFTITLPCK